jgi:hypothetical protein
MSNFVSRMVAGTNIIGRRSSFQPPAFLAVGHPAASVLGLLCSAPLMRRRRRIASSTARLGRARAFKHGLAAPASCSSRHASTESCTSWPRTAGLPTWVAAHRSACLLVSYLAALPAAFFALRSSVIRGATVSASPRLGFSPLSDLGRDRSGRGRGSGTGFPVGASSAPSQAGATRSSPVVQLASVTGVIRLPLRARLPPRRVRRPRAVAAERSARSHRWGAGAGGRSASSRS